MSSAAAQPVLLLAVRFEVVPRGVIRVLGGMRVVRVRDVSVVCRLVVVAGFMMLRCFGVVMGGHSVMVGCLFVMMRCLL